MNAAQLRKDPLTGRWVAHLDLSGALPANEPAVLPEAVHPQLELYEGTGAFWGPHPEAALDRRSRVDRQRSDDLLHSSMTAAGAHELIFESQEAGGSSDPQALQDGLIVARERIRALSDDNRCRQLVWIKRHGLAAGARYAAPHAELLGMPVVSASGRERLMAFQAHARRTGGCVLCEMIKLERTKGDRFVQESLRHAVLAPFGSASAFELLIAPKGHHASFGSSSDEELGDLAQLMIDALSRMAGALNQPAYTAVLHESPPDAGADLVQFHWHIVLRPNLVLPSATDPVFDFCPVPPKLTAKLLAAP